MNTNSILLVDDEDLIRKSLENQIRQEGYDIATAATGQEALLKFDAVKFDLLILDLALPDISGLDILKRAKADRPSTAVIIITGYGDMTTAIDALRLGADEYLLKPCNRDELLHRIDQCLQKRRIAKRLRMYKEIIGATDDLVSLIGADYSFLIANDACARFVAREPDDLVGIKVHEIFGQDFFERKMRKRLDRCIAGQAGRHQYYLTGADGRQRFFHFSYAPYISGNGRKNAAVVTVRDLTDYNRLSEELRALNAGLEGEVAKRTAQLARQKEDLEQVNAALTVLLKKRELDRKELEEQMLANIKTLAAPYVDKLRRSGLDERQQSWLDILSENLDNVLSPFAHHLSAGHLQLTPAEIQIANFIREGKTSKEIAEIMNLSPETISNHRKHIRKKSGLTNKKVNLRTALASMPLI